MLPRENFIFVTQPHTMSHSYQRLEAQQPIGIFDSGVGGLTVAREIRRTLPGESFIYFGDTKHLPYGEKSREAIAGYSVKIAKFLLDKGCKAIVIACNSATANALEEVIAVVDGRVPVIDVIHPVARQIASGEHRHVGVIATKATVNSALYKKVIRSHAKQVKVSELATPLLVPAIEEGFKNHPITTSIIGHYLGSSKLKNIDTLILGCTHYPLLLQEIKRYYKNVVQVVDSPAIVAQELRQLLADNHLLNSGASSHQEFYVSDLTKNFATISRRIFGKDIQLQQITL